MDFYSICVHMLVMFAVRLTLFVIIAVFLGRVWLFAGHVFGIVCTFCCTLLMIFGSLLGAEGNQSS